ncbi:MAG TPA: hypothetical protein VE959_26800 [Bryobacteraceae bacterium]|nr:hypothetical protein [Bryobacteraceae bacterium]
MTTPSAEARRTGMNNMISLIVPLLAIGVATLMPSAAGSSAA